MTASTHKDRTVTVNLIMSSIRLMPCDIRILSGFLYFSAAITKLDEERAVHCIGLHNYTIHVEENKIIVTIGYKPIAT